MDKIKDYDKLSKKEIRNGANFFDVDREICRINGEKYPMFYAKIINKQLANEMPFVLFLGKPGSGKTFASAKLGYDLHEKVDFYSGEYDPTHNVNYENIPFMENVLESQNQVMHKADINATLKVSDHHKDSNRAFENFLHLSRILGNLITGDAQFLWRCDTGIQITHTFRIVATPNAFEYAFDVYYINREPDSETKEQEKVFLQRWRPDLPPKNLRNFIKEHDEKSKKEIMREELEKAKEEKSGSGSAESEFEIA